jgi:hypothetical protein
MVLLIVSMSDWVSRPASGTFEVSVNAGVPGGKLMAAGLAVIEIRTESKTLPAGGVPGEGDGDGDGEGGATTTLADGCGASEAAFIEAMSDTMRSGGLSTTGGATKAAGWASSVGCNAARAARSAAASTVPCLALSAAMRSAALIDDTSPTLNSRDSEAAGNCAMPQMSKRLTTSATAARSREVQTVCPAIRRSASSHNWVSSFMAAIRAAAATACA